MSFQDFKNDLTRFMTRVKKNVDDIAYINISKTHYMTPESFFALEKPPQLENWEDFAQNQMGTWDIYGKFQVVLKDNSWIEYLCCDDEFYSRFTIHAPLKQACEQYLPFSV